MRIASTQNARAWAQEEFGHAELGDPRRTKRLVRMATSLAESPGGKIVEVFRSNADQQGAYDFLANEEVRAESLLNAVRGATAQRCANQSWVHVVVDGTSLRIVDRQRVKGFGGVGSTLNGASGLKVVHAYAVSSDGIPLGVLNQQWWIRARRQKRNDCDDRPLDDKESQHWVNAIGDAAMTLDAVRTRPWFQVDREGDRYWTLKALQDCGGWFTVRSTYAHRFVFAGARKRRLRLRAAIAKGRFRGAFTISLRERPNRRAREAKVHIRTTTVVLDTTEAFSGERMELPVNVVEVREVGTTPRGAEPLHWRLLTNHPINTDEEIEAILTGYAQRWKIEELHRVWKSGACRVEQTQLRSPDRVIKWAVLTVVTAARIERLRMQARTDPHAPASIAFNGHELRALTLMKRKYAKRTETIPDSMPSMADAVRWLAELGGHTGRKSSGPPGAVTIRRGLEFITPIALAFEALESDPDL